MTTPIEVAVENGVQTIRLNRPEKKNAITSAMYAAMAEAIKAGWGDDAVRATLAERDLDRRLPAEEPAAESEQELLERYVSAFEAYDVDGLAALLHEDAVFSMPPYTLWLRGPDSVRTWLSGRGSGCRGSRLVPTAACGLPAFGQYRASADGGHEPWALVVLEIEDGRIVGWTSFLDVETLFPRFGLPAGLPAASTG